MSSYRFVEQIDDRLRADLPGSDVNFMRRARNS